MTSAVRPGAELDDVVPVAADLGALDAGPVVGRDLEVLGVEAASAAAGCAGARRRSRARARPPPRSAAASGERLLGRALLGDVLQRCRAAGRRAVLVALELAAARGPARSAPSGADDAGTRSRTARRARRRPSMRRAHALAVVGVDDASSAPSRPPVAQLVGASTASWRRNSSEAADRARWRGRSPSCRRRASRCGLVEQLAAALELRRGSAGPGRARGWRARAPAARGP